MDILLKRNERCCPYSWRNSWESIASGLLSTGHECGKRWVWTDSAVSKSVFNMYYFKSHFLSLSTFVIAHLASTNHQKCHTKKVIGDAQVAQ